MKIFAQLIPEELFLKEAISSKIMIVVFLSIVGVSIIFTIIFMLIDIKVSPKTAGRLYLVLAGWYGIIGLIWLKKYFFDKTSSSLFFTLLLFYFAGGNLYLYCLCKKGKIIPGKGPLTKYINPKKIPALVGGTFLFCTLISWIGFIKTHFLLFLILTLLFLIGSISSFVIYLKKR